MDARAQVLVVDDEEDILAATKAYLESTLAVQVGTSSSGPGALGMLRDGYRPDVVLSDYRMPGMDGLAFLQEAERLLPDRPRVLMTAYPDLQLAISALNEARISRFLTKPLDPARLKAEVRDLLSSSRQERARDKAFRRASRPTG